MLSPSLADALFWLAAVSCLVYHAAIVVSVLRAPRAREGHDDAPAPPRRAAEIVWAVLPALVLAVVLVATWRTMHPSV